jgi:hypothetical protein
MQANRDSIMKPAAQHGVIAGDPRPIPVGMKFMVTADGPSACASCFFHKTALHAGFISAM